MTTLHPALATWLAQVNATQAQRLAAGQQTTPISAREALAGLIAAMVPPGPALPWVHEAMVPGDYPVPVRAYHPAPDTPLPLLVYCHGGGHMAGSVSSYDPLCRRLAQATQHVVVSVEYRLAPECPYPAALHDVCTVLRGVRPTLLARGARLADSAPVLAGDSGGAALAATVAQWAQHDASLAIRALQLIYPSVDYTLTQPSIRRLGQGYLLEAERIGWYFEHYFRLGGDRVAASPLLGEVSAQHVPTQILTAGYDPLHDEGLAYARKLAAAGVAVDYHCAADQIHAYLLLEALVPDACADAYRRMAGFVNGSALHAAPPVV